MDSAQGETLISSTNYFERQRANLLKFAISSADSVSCWESVIASGFASESRSEAKMRGEGRALGRRFPDVRSVGSGCTRSGTQAEHGRYTLRVNNQSSPKGNNGYD